MENLEQKKPRKQKKKVTRKWSSEETAWWKRIYKYVETEIFSYGEGMKLQKKAVLMLQGLSNGKYITNNNIEDNGNYPPQVVYGALVIARPKFLSASKNVMFESEDHMTAYLCAIARSHINAAYVSYLKNAQTESISKGIVPVEHTGAKFVPKDNKINGDEGLW